MSPSGNFKDDHSSAPRLCQVWCRTQAAAPSIPILGMDFGFTVLSAFFLAAVRFLMEYTQVYIFDWPEASFVTKNAASSAAAIVHSTLLVPTLATCFIKRPYQPSESLDGETVPRWYQQTATALLQFCSGYMLYDGLLNVLWLNYTLNPAGLGDDAVVFGVHHIATFLYMTSTRILQAGHQSAMICMLLGECTNPFHNAYYIALAAQSLDCCNGSWSQWMFSVIEFTFASSYFVARALIAPVAWSHLTYCLWFRRNPRIPLWILSIWTFLIWLVEIGSIPYIGTCYNLTVKYLQIMINATQTSVVTDSSEL